MTLQQTVNPEAAPSSGNETQRLLEDVAQLVRGTLSPPDFYRQLVGHVVKALGAVGGAAWTCDDHGDLHLAGEVNLRATGLFDDDDYQARHGQLLKHVLASGKGTLINQQAAAGPQHGAGKEEMLLLFGPLKNGANTNDANTHGLLEIFLDPDNTRRDRQELLGVVLKACQLAGEFHAPGALPARPDRDTQKLWAQLESFTRAVHAGLDLRSTAYTIANEGRRLIACDRVSVAVLRGRKCRIEAISGQDRFDGRSNTARLLARLASAVSAAGEPLWYSGETRDLPPQLERAVQAYADESQSKMVAVLPLFRDFDDDEPKRQRTPPLGALIVEQIEDTTPRQGFRQRVQAVSNHSALALGNVLEHNSLFLLPLWRVLGKLGLVVRLRTLPKTLAALAFVAALASVLALTPGDFYLEGRGTLQPVVRHDVFARVSGQVIDINEIKDADHLWHVAEGARLLTMRSSELESKIIELGGQLQTKQEELYSLEVDRNGERLTRAEKNRLTGRIKAHRAGISSLITQLDLYKKRRDYLTVLSPINGTVTTLDVGQRLMRRPVQRGDALLRVADLDGKWELEVRMPEDRMGHILEAHNELLRQRREQPGADLPGGLPVHFILATDPDKTFIGTVTKIHERAQVRGDEGNTVLIKVAIDKNELPQLRPGASVIAKVHCGRRSLGFVWFHDLIEFVQSRILFRF